MMMKAFFTKVSTFKLGMAAGVIGVFGFATLMGLSLFHERENRVEHARIETENISRVLEEHARATIQKVDISLKNVRWYLRQVNMHVAKGANTRDTMATNELLAAQLAVTPELQVIQIANASGDYIYSSINPVPAINIADRPFFQRHKESASSGLVISQPLLSRTLGTWVVTVSRRVNFSDGSFAGIVNAIIELSSFEKFYASLDMGPHGAVLLRDAQMRLLARYPRLEQNMGLAMPEHPAAKLIAQGSEDGVYVEYSPADGTKRIYSYRRVGDYPLYVLAAIAEEDYLAEWHKHLLRTCTAGLLFALVSFALTMVARIGLLKQKEAEQALARHHEQLEQLVSERTQELQDANKELESFSYSVSHDLRAPLRAIDGFSHILLERYIDKLDDEGKRLLNIVRSNTQRMAQLIDDILGFSRNGRLEMTVSDIDMENMAREVFAEIQPTGSSSRLRFEVGHLPPATGDRAMLRQVFTNLLSNAIKFSHTQETPKIVVGGAMEGNEAVYYVTDNGVGFDMQYAEKLFGVFQRLHGMDEFDGTGIGLAIVKRIVVRHGGRVWAQGRIGEGATFYFSLPLHAG